MYKNLIVKVLMIIHDFDFIGIPISPYKANSPLIIYPNTVLPLAAAVQLFQPIGWWNQQILQLPRRMQKCQSTICDLLNVLWQFPRKETMKHLLRFSGFEGLDHAKMILSSGNTVKRYLFKNRAIWEKRPFLHTVSRLGFN